MKTYMLDTNTISFAIKQHPQVMRHIQSVTMNTLCISAISHAELTYGLAKKPDATRLHRVIREFLLRVDVMPFDEQAAQTYGVFKANCERLGKNLTTLDMLIAAHAHSLGLTLVSNDKAFQQIAALCVVDWTKV